LSLENVKKVKMKVPFFNEEVSLDFEVKKKKNNEYKGIVIYGKNGSGKTTISNSFLCNECENDCEKCKYGIQKAEIEFADEKDKIYTISKDNIYVYNEKFIEKNVSFKDEDGLNAIVMFGSQVDKTKELEIEQIKIMQKEDELKNFEKILKECNNPKNEQSEQYYMNLIKDKIKESRWVERAEEIRKLEKNGKRRNLTSEIVEEIMKSEDGKESMLQLNAEFESLKDKMLQSEKYFEVLDKKINIINLDDGLIDNIERLLLLKLNNNEEKNNEIIKVVDERGTKFYEEVRKEVSKENVKKCPYCFQNLSAEYKEKLILDISRILNKEVEAHNCELEKMKTIIANKNLEIINLDNMEILDKELVLAIKNDFLEFEKIKGEIINQINKKIANVYTPIYYQFDELVHVIKNINTNIMKLNEKKNKIREELDDPKGIIDKLKKINNSIAKCESKIYYDLYYNTKSNKEVVEEKVLLIKEEINVLSRNIEYIKAELTQIEIAVDEINNSLKYIFFDNKRLQIEVQDGKYYTKVNNKNVALKNLSTGERNIIALSYFFTTMLENEKVEDKFKKEMLVVIDDPVSSFDIENKIGIYSFIREKLNRIYKANEKSKVIILTHNLEVKSNIEDVFDDISVKYLLYELNNYKLTQVEHNKKKENMYTKLLEETYNYALGNNREEMELYIGNTMRKVLEAFGTFNYKEGISRITTNELILNKIEDSNLRSIFNNLMYRLLLHNESHTEDLSKRYPDDDFFNYIDCEEKIKTAKYVLVFLYLLDRVHILIHLGEGCEENIERWKKEMLEG